MTEHCARCGFVGTDALEGMDWSHSDMETGDWPYTGQYYCAHGRGCNKAATTEVMDGGSSIILNHPTPPNPDGLNP